MPHAAEAAAVADLARGRSHLRVVGDGPIDRRVGNFDAGIACRQQTDQHRPADRSIGVGAVGRIAPAADRVFLLRSERSADRQFEGLANGARLAADAGPEIAIVDGAIGFGQGEHGEAMFVHAGADDAGVAALRRDEAAQAAADMIAVEPEVRVLARGEHDHQPERGRADAGGADAVVLATVAPFAAFLLTVGQILQAAVVDLAHVAGNRFAETDGRVLATARAGSRQARTAENRMRRPNAGAGRFDASRLSLS